MEIPETRVVVFLAMGIPHKSFDAKLDRAGTKTFHNTGKIVLKDCGNKISMGEPNFMKI